jgi:hypothetical protein
MGLDHLFTGSAVRSRVSGVWPLRIPAPSQEPAFPADCLHRPIFTADHLAGEYEADTQGSQHIARFINVTTTVNL